MSEALYSGDMLREQREALGFTTEAVFREIRIPTAQIEALERGDFAALPATYVVGFLRTYCTFLELEPEAFVDAYRASVAPASRFTRFTMRNTPSDAPSRRDTWLTWGAISALILLGWFAYTLVFQPEADVTTNRIEADTVSIAAPPVPDTTDF